MLISHIKRFIYIKTNKTASTSVEMMLQRFCQTNQHSPIVEKTHALFSEAGIVGQRLIPSSEATGLDKKWFNHMPARLICDLIGSEIWYNYRKVHTTRNPFDKVLSSFFWKSSLRDCNYESFDAAKSAFTDYVLRQDWNNDYEILHIDGEYCGDLAIRYENIKDDLAKLAERCNLDLSAMSLPHTKKTTSLRMRRNTAEYYSHPTIECVLNRCEWIFNKFSYETRPDGL